LAQLALPYLARAKAGSARCPVRKHGELYFEVEFGKVLQEFLLVPVAYEYYSALDTPDHDGVQESGGLPAIARLSRGGRASMHDRLLHCVTHICYSLYESNEP
jgi:hypothetical protein